MMHRYHILLLLLLLPFTGSAQYTMRGTIEFEKKVNQHANMKDNAEDPNSSWLQRWLTTTPKFSSSFFNLYFDTARSIYRPGREVESPNKMFWSEPASDNIVLTDFNTRRVSSVKNVFEQKLLVQDSMRTMEWKVKDEIRTIANYKCRKAVGRICDSVYVVAFFSEDILAPGGPEMFGGLPGMILELAIPRLHTTWVATKVEQTIPADADFSVGSKGKKVNQKELYETIQSSLKSWGKWAAKNIWWCSL